VTWESPNCEIERRSWSRGRPARESSIGAVIRRSTESGSRLKVCGSMSAKTTVSPAARASSGTTQKVSDGRMISEPGGKSSASSMW